MRGLLSNISVFVFLAAASVAVAGPNMALDNVLVSRKNGVGQLQIRPACRMQYLSQSAAFSTLTVHVIPDELSQPIEVAGWRPGGNTRCTGSAKRFHIFDSGGNR